MPSKDRSAPLPQAPPDLPVGGRIGPYDVLAYMASGGMAEIFLARAGGVQDIIHKLVVIKRILPHLATDSAIVEMFLDEARLAAMLQHPNVVHTHDVGFVDGRYYMAMEYLQGENIRAIGKALHRRQEVLPLEHTLFIVMGVCAGLHYAHEKTGPDGEPLNTVHRDVTPSNVFVTFEGGVKLIDFGIAKTANRFSRGTSAGTLKGKIPYMSPEQCRGEPLDRRSDIFSLGVMLYEMSLNRALFRARSDFELLKKIAEAEVPPPSSVYPNYLPGLEAIVMKALAKDPADRYATARDMQADLEALVRETRLPVSSISLQQFMEKLFAEKRDAWREVELRRRPIQSYVQLLEKQRVDEQGAEGAASGPSLVSGAAAATPRRRRIFRIAATAMGALGLWAAWELRAMHLRSVELERVTALATPTAPVEPPSAAPADLAMIAKQPEEPEVTVAPPPPGEPVPATPARASTHRSRAHESKHGKATPEESVPTTGEGTFVVASDPWCRVLIDGKERGATPLQLKLPAGRHAVVLSNPEFKIQREFEIVVRADGVVRKSFEFAR